MPHPEGYRKAMRLMELAAQFRFPIITLIDTPGAYPGIGAEERGQAERDRPLLAVMARARRCRSIAVRHRRGRHRRRPRDRLGDRS